MNKDQKMNTQAPAVSLSCNVAEGVWADGISMQIETFSAACACSNMMWFGLYATNAWCTKSSYFQFTTSNTVYSLPEQTAKAADAMQPVALLQMHAGV